MERLTEISSRGTAHLKGTLANYSSISYECQIKEGVELLKKALKKLAEYEDLEENALLVRLPCKLGSKFYHVNGKFILEFTAYSFNVNEDGAWLIHAEHYSEEAKRTFSMCFETDAIGKTVFLTQAEAEAKLREMEGENEKM